MKKATLNVDLDAILYNCKHLKCYYKKNIIAVLKDDAYGLGLIPIALHIEKVIDMIAVSKIDEIISLRNNNINKPILYLNVFDELDIDIIKKYNVCVIVDNLERLDLALNNNLDFHLKINCGMNRLGLYKKDIDKAINIINKTPCNIKGVMAHFADKDFDHSAYKTFKEHVIKIKKKDLMIHCHASRSLDYYFDNITSHIRIGLKLYGLERKNLFLQNAISLYSDILAINKVNKDEYVGYDKTYQTNQDGYLYILPIGYGSGLKRVNNLLAYVDNTYLKQAGKMSMDYTTFFQTKQLKKDVLLELFGKNIPLEQICNNETSIYEMLVNLKLEKRYIKENSNSTTCDKDNYLK